MIFLYAINRNRIRDRYDAEVNVKACVTCDRELGMDTAICPKCGARQPAQVAQPEPSSLEDDEPTTQPPEFVVCSVCKLEVIPDEDDRCPECRWPV